MCLIQCRNEILCLLIKVLTFEICKQHESNEPVSILQSEKPILLQILNVQY